MKSIFACFLPVILFQVGSAVVFNPRVIGGQNALSYQFSYVVSIQWSSPILISYKHLCSGVIVDEFWILTAAHCIENLPKYRKCRIKAGMYNGNIKIQSIQNMEIAKRIIHGGYDRERNNDIGLLKLATSLNLTEYVRIAKLPLPRSVQFGSAVMIGWELASIDGQKKYKVLKAAFVPIINIRDCLNLSRTWSSEFSVAESEICTGPIDGSISACPGDSGGPLVKNNDQIPQVIGILSLGLWHYSKTMTVYTRVSYFTDWIYRTINKN